MLPDLIARCLFRFIDKPYREKAVTQHNHDRFLLNMFDHKSTNLEASIASTSNAHILKLINQLYSLEQRDTPTTAYLHRAKNLADQLSDAGRPITLSEFNIFTLRGLRPEFKDVVIALSALEGPVSFPELHSLLLSHEFVHGHRDRNYVNKPMDKIAENSTICCNDVRVEEYGANYDDQRCLSKMMEKNNYSVDMKNSKIQDMEDDYENSILKVNNMNLSVQRIKDDWNNLKAKGDNSAISRDDFPEDFVFGTATSSYQFEGAATQGGRGLGVWDIFTMETPDRIFDGTNGNVAVDMYNRYKEDIEMMKKMGFGACRISISWPRLLPGGRCTAGVNREGINFYNDLINTLLAHGIEPYVTLFHWDLPYCLEKEYDGFLSKQIVDDFREFVELCFWEFGDRVKTWITLNEPWSYCTSGYVSGKFPPSKPAAPADKIGNNLTTYRAIHDPKSTVPTEHSYFNSTLKSDPAKDAYTVARNLLLAHSAAVHSYRTKFQEYQEGKIGMVLCCQWYEPYNENSDQDVAASKRAMDFMMGWFLEPMLTGKYPDSMSNYVPANNFAQFSDEESQMLKGSIDFLGLNYYTANYVANDISPNSEKAYYKDQQVAFHTEKEGKLIGPLAGSTWLYIVPWGIYKLLKHIKDTYKDMPPIYITENGVDEKYDCKLTAYDVCADTTRVKYHQDHLAYILKAMNEENVNVKGYFVWAYCDNFEWYEGYTVRFGLIYIDYMNNLTRYPKNSAVWFTKFLRKRKRTKAKYNIIDKLINQNIKFIKD